MAAKYNVPMIDSSQSSNEASSDYEEESSRTITEESKEDQP